MSKETILAATYIVLAIIGVVLLGWLYRNLPTVLYSLWFVPIVILFVAFKLKLSSKFRKPYVVFLAKAVLGFSLFMSLITLFGDWDGLRDYVGNNYVDGYSVRYYEDCCADDGSPFMAADISTSTWLGRVFLWAFEWVFILMLAALNITVFLIYKGIEKQPLLEKSST